MHLKINHIEEKIPVLKAISFFICFFSAFSTRSVLFIIYFCYKKLTGVIGFNSVVLKLTIFKFFLISYSRALKSFAQNFVTYKHLIVLKMYKVLY